MNDASTQNEKKVYQIKLTERNVERFKERHGDTHIFWGVLDRFLELYNALDDNDEGFDRLLRSLGRKIKTEIEVE